MIKITRTFFIPENEFEEKFILSSGPGGQNVNKVATGVQLRFDIGKSSTLLDEVKERLRHIARTQITTEDVLIVESKEYRSQQKNRKQAQSKLAHLVRKALTPPKIRKETQPTRESEQKRLKYKKMIAKKKALRKGPPAE
jgi:ribosome-associated protein